MRTAARVDANQAQIVKDLRNMGFDVDIVSREKKMYDIVVSGVPLWSSHVVALRVEIKTDKKKKLTKDESEYWDAQRNRKNLIIAYSVDDVLEWFGKI